MGPAARMRRQRGPGRAPRRRDYSPSAAVICPFRWRPPFFLLVAALLGPPIAWHNVISGFHSQQFFLIGLSFGAIAWLPCAGVGSAPLVARRRLRGPRPRQHGLGILCRDRRRGTLLGLRLAPRRRWRPPRRCPPWFFAAPWRRSDGCPASRCPGMTPSGPTAPLNSTSAVLHSLQWPLLPPAPPVLAVFLLWTPWVLLAWGLLRTRRPRPGRQSRPRRARPGRLGAPPDRGHRLCPRGRRPPPASRYFDTLRLGGVANGLALAWLAKGASAGRRPGWAVVAAGWAALFSLGYGAQLREQSQSGVAGNTPDTI